jgi:type II secretory pathway pseudopilin PulG
MRASPQPERGDPEAGYLLLAVVVMVALVLIALSVAAPVVARELRRDKEVESQHRAEQYVRAVQLFYRKNKSYPASIKALENTNNVRYLRQEYVDPLTGKSDWKLIHQGQQKTTIKGFFGEELAGMTANLGSAQGLSSGVGTPIGGTSGSSSTSTIGATSALASGFQGASTTTTTGGTPGTTGASGTTGSTGSSAFGDGQGGPIVGVSTARSGESITEPNQQSSYNTWEFWYDPRIELLKQGVSITGGGMSSKSASSFGTDINGKPNSGSGASGAFGSTGTTTPGSGTSTTPGGTTPP